jgi:pimeloyl-ACP methyl ester carboxylesterase
VPSIASPIAYEGRGHSGPPFLLVHGFPLDRTMWRGQIDALAQHARVVALDLPGFGASGALADGGRAYTMDAMAEHVIAVADALGFDRFILGGLSMGGYVAFSILRKHRARVLGLALVDTRAEADTPDARRVRYEDAERVLAEGTGFLVDKMIPKLLAPRTIAERADLKNGVELMMRRAAPTAVAAGLRGLGDRRDVRAELAKIDVPTLVVVGAEDVITPPESARAMAQAIRGAQLAVIANAGHMAPWEQPEATNVALRKLIRKVNALS